MQNIVLVPTSAAKTAPTCRGTESTTPLQAGCGICTKMLATDPLSPVRFVVGPPWIGLACPAHPTDVQLD